MLPVVKELQKLKGVGEVLSRRFVEAGYDALPRSRPLAKMDSVKYPELIPACLTQ